MIWRTLSGRLLLLTIAFVMLAEVLIFVPSVARFREDYLRERLEKAQIAAMALDAAPDGRLTSVLELQLLENADILSVAFKRDQRRELVLMGDMHHPMSAVFDLRSPSVTTLILDALSCAFTSEQRYITVIGEPFLEGDLVEVMVDESKLKVAMMEYGLKIFWLSLFISVITAGLIFISVNAFLLRPVNCLIERIIKLREAPEGAVTTPMAGVGGALGRADRELTATQQEIRSALKQKSRLAALGEAVAKINHDLRNILASAQLFADRMETSRDPMVARAAPKLVKSIDRAVRLCKHTLEFGRAEEPAPEAQSLSLHAAVDDVFASLNAGPDDAPVVRLINHVSPGQTVWADPDHLFRAMLNIARNAAQAIEASGKQGRIWIEARNTSNDDVLIDIADDGPGLPAKAKENLFKAFKGSTRPGGSGLGLVIAAELMRAHGGGVELIDQEGGGARFRLTLPPPSRHSLSHTARSVSIGGVGSAAS